MPPMILLLIKRNIYHRTCSKSQDLNEGYSIFICLFNNPLISFAPAGAMKMDEQCDLITIITRYLLDHRIKIVILINL